MIPEILALFGVAILSAFAREIYGNKGLIILPHNTEKGYALGIVGSIIFAIFAVIINLPIVMQDSSFTMAIAISLGLSWGIAANDIVANVLSKVNGGGS